MHFFVIVANIQTKASGWRCRSDCVKAADLVVETKQKNTCKQCEQPIQMTLLSGKTNPSTKSLRDKSPDIKHNTQNNGMSIFKLYYDLL